MYSPHSLKPVSFLFMCGTQNKIFIRTSKLYFFHVMKVNGDQDCQLSFSVKKPPYKLKFWVNDPFNY